MIDKTLIISMDVKNLLILILFVSTLCAADQLVSYKKLPNNLGSFGLINRKRVEGYRFNGNVTLSQEVIKEDDCFELCLKNSKDCQTFNVVDNAEKTIKLCELVDGRGFTTEGNLEQNINSVHYGLETKCWSNPCGNNGMCVAKYAIDSFFCNCTDCYEGTLCEISKVPISEAEKYSCADYATSTTNGVYQVSLGEEKIVSCDMENGGWTLIQRRMDGSVDFERNWEEYKNGFGDPCSDYWLGNDAIHLLTKNTCELNFTMKFQGQWYYAYYDSFTVGDESSNYLLSVSGYQGNAGDNFGFHNGMMFSTADKDNDRNGGENCAAKYHGGWWYEVCHRVNINGLWGAKYDAMGVVWWDVTWYLDSLDYIDMKVLC